MAPHSPVCFAPRCSYCHQTAVAIIRNSTILRDGGRKFPLPAENRGPTSAGGAAWKTCLPTRERQGCSPADFHHSDCMTPHRGRPSLRKPCFAAAILPELGRRWHLCTIQI